MYYPCTLYIPSIRLYVSCWPLTCCSNRTVRKRRRKSSHHLPPRVALLLLLLVVEHGRVQRQPPPGPVLAGEHHHGWLHPGHRLLQHVGGGHGEPVGVRVPGLQPAALLCCSALLLWITDAERVCRPDAGPSPLIYSHRRGGGGF